MFCSGGYDDFYVLFMMGLFRGMFRGGGGGGGGGGMRLRMFLFFNSK